jgi:hypothetical protein
MLSSATDSRSRPPGQSDTAAYPSDVGRCLAERPVQDGLARIEALGVDVVAEDHGGLFPGDVRHLPGPLWRSHLDLDRGRDREMLWPRRMEKQAVGLLKKSSRSETRSGSGSITSACERQRWCATARGLRCVSL